MINFIKKTLKNGVTLYLYPDPKMLRYYVDYSVRYGSSGKYFKFYYDGKLYEVQPGVAHFLEHMLGEHSKYGNFYQIFSDKNYQKNGMTYQELTRYFFCGYKDVKESIKLLINAIDDPVFTKEDVEKTKPAIIEETKRGLNNIYQKCSIMCYRNLYKGVDTFHKSLSSIGDEETTKSLDYETLKLCYDAFYYDENKTLLIAGNFDPDEMTEYIESIYKELKPHPNKYKPYNYHDLDEVKTSYEEIYDNVSEELVSIGFKEKNKHSFSRKEISIYSKFLYQSKLYEECNFVDKLKRNSIIAFMNSRSFTIYDDNHFTLEIEASVKDYNKYLKALFKELKKNNFKEQDFKLFIKSRIADEVGKIDNKYRVFGSFKSDLPYTENFSDVEFLKTLTFDRFLEFYKSLNFDKYTIAVVKDKNIDK